MPNPINRLFNKLLMHIPHVREMAVECTVCSTWLEHYKELAMESEREIFTLKMQLAKYEGRRIVDNEKRKLRHLHAVKKRCLEPVPKQA